MNPLRYGAVALALASAAACGLGDPAQPSSGGDVISPSPQGSASGGPGSMGSDAASDCAQPPTCFDFPLGASPHIVRLTNSQWELTTKDLLRLDVAPGNSIAFAPDPELRTGKEFGIDARSLYVDGDGWKHYKAAAVDVATMVVSDPTKRNRILPAIALDEAQTEQVRYDAFLADFLPRAYRRPVTSDELAAMTAATVMFETSAVSGDPFQNRVLATIEAALQSPYFLYRVAGGEETVLNKRARLTPYELASKLSYALWNTMPDDALITRAKMGELASAEGVANVARDMLQDDRARANIVRFHDELYETALYADNLNPNSRKLVDFPTYSPDFAADVITDMRKSVEEIVFNQSGGLKELLTSRVAFVNRRLAKVYGIDPQTLSGLADAGAGDGGDGGAPPDDTWVQISMEASRKGVLMHPGWLAYEGTGNEPSTIHRGVYVARHVVCQALGDPPAAAIGKDPSMAAGHTNRDRVAALTHPCGDGCHGAPGGIINPLGFGFEKFDSIGKVRLTDEGYPIDTTGSLPLLGSYADAAEMFEKISSNAYAHACYAAHWSAYLNNATTLDVTPKWLAPAVAKSLAGGSVRDMLVELVKTDAFQTVSR